MDKKSKTAYVRGRIDAELSVERMLLNEATEIGVRIMDLMANLVPLERHAVAVGFCDGLIREIIVRERELSLLRAQLREKGGADETRH